MRSFAFSRRTHRRDPGRLEKFRFQYPDCLLFYSCWCSSILWISVSSDEWSYYILSLFFSRRLFKISGFPSHFLLTYLSNCLAVEIWQPFHVRRSCMTTVAYILYKQAVLVMWVCPWPRWHWTHPQVGHVLVFFFFVSLILICKMHR